MLAKFRSPLRASAFAALGFLCLTISSQRLLAETPLPGPAPTQKDIAYASSTPADGQGHLLDLYMPEQHSSNVPLVIFTHGSGWMMDNGRFDAQALAAILNPRGYAVAGVAIRSSSQTQFPGQLYDIKAAVRWLRSNAERLGIDGNHIGILGESSGGWTAAMAATTGDVPELEGDLGTTGVSSAVQAAVAFYPPTDISAMDRNAAVPCDPEAVPFENAFCHSTSGSPESRFLGCTVSTCPERAALANPINYITRRDPPIMVIHGENDMMVPHQQGEALYQALNKACHDSAFISLPLAGHAVWDSMMTDPNLAYGATIRTTSAEGCKVELPHPLTPSWDVVVSFLDRSLKDH